MTTFAVISLAGKQHVVREGQRLLVDRLPYDEGKTFHPDVLTGGEGDKLDDKLTVTAVVVGHTLGEKIRIGKYKKRTGYKRHNGYRSHLSQIEIQSVGAKRAAAKKTEAAATATEEKPKAAAKPKAATATAAKAPAKPKAETAAAKTAAAKKPAAPKKPAAAKPATEKKAPARKPAAKKTEDEG